MEIKGVIHCLFEQTGTFKNEFKKLGYKAYDYDIQNNFGETDYQIDIFKEINSYYEGVNNTIFDNMNESDLIIAFFPCIHFECQSMLNYLYNCNNYRGLKGPERIRKIIKRSQERQKNYEILLKLFYICDEKKLRIILENPMGGVNFLKNNFLIPPTFIDKDRTRRGDNFKKPTAYWFFNCEPEFGFTQCQTPKKKILKILKTKSSLTAGICSEERSMITPEYAHNFICDNVIGINSKYEKQKTLNL